MLTSRKPVSFLATCDPEAAKRFYRDTLGLKLVETGPYAHVFMDGAQMLRIQIVDEVIHIDYTAHGWLVESIQREVAALSAKGVDFLAFEQLEQDVANIWKSPDGHKIAWFKDPSGNMLSLTEYTSLE